MSDKIRKEVWLTQEAIDKLQAQADKEQRPLKKHLEHLLIKQSEKPVK